MRPHHEKGEAMISREQLQSIEWAIKDEDGGSWCPACASPADIGHKCDCWLARALAAPPADAGAHKTGPQPTACGGAAAMPISGSRTPGMTEAAKLRDDAGVSAEGVTAGETALSADAGAPEREPRCKMRHRMDGAIYICTREVDHPGEHRSGSARSWPADAGAPPALVALVAEVVAVWKGNTTWNQRMAAIKRLMAWTPAPVAAPPADLVALVREWQDAEREFDDTPMASTYAVRKKRLNRKLVAEKALLAFPLPEVPDDPMPQVVVGDVVIEQTFPNDGVRVTDADQAQSCNVNAGALLAIYRTPLWQRKTSEVPDETR